MKHLLSLLLFGLLVTLSIEAQTPADIFRYSQRGYSGTARSISLGGAQTALGADFGSLSYNPAGVALYRSSELTLTPSLDFVKGQSTLSGNVNETSENGFSLGGAGLVLTTNPRKRKQEKGWKFINIGVGFNRVYNNEREFLSNAFNDDNSITDFFAENAGGFTEPQLFDNSLNEYGALAYRSYLIDPTDTDGEYTSILNGGQVDQQERITRTGKKSEIIIDYGANLKDKYYFGVALGIVAMTSGQRVFFSERDDFGTHANFDFLELSETVNATGSGLNLSIGTIIRLTEALRFGASLKSPTRMSITETFNTDLRARAIGANGLETFEESSPDGFFEYDYTEPYRFNTGLAYFLKKRALISLEYELVDYSTMKAHYREDAFAATENALNQGIKNRYKAAHTFKLGIEMVLRHNLYARFGGSSMSSPFNNEELDGAISRFGAGIGYRGERYFFDLAYGSSKENSVRQPYELSNQEVASIDVCQRESNMMLTVGTRF